MNHQLSDTIRWFLILAVGSFFPLPGIAQPKCPEPKAADFRRDILVPLGQLK